MTESEYHVKRGYKRAEKRWGSGLKNPTGVYCSSTCGRLEWFGGSMSPLYSLMAEEFSCITYIISKVPEEMKEKQNVGEILQG